MNTAERNTTHAVAQLSDGTLIAPSKLSNTRTLSTMQEVASLGGAVFLGTREVAYRVYQALLSPVASPDCHSTVTERFSFGPAADGTTDVRIIRTTISQDLADALMELLDGDTQKHAELRGQMGIRTALEAEDARRAWRGEIYTPEDSFVNDGTELDRFTQYAPTPLEADENLPAIEASLTEAA